MAIDRAPSPPPTPPITERVERFKRTAAQAAAEMVSDGMKVGLGTGSTVAHLLDALAARRLAGIRCVATSPATAHAASLLGLSVHSLEDLDGTLDIAIDGADQVAPDGWLIKGGGAAHTREKIVACAAVRFVVIVSPEKLVDRLHPPVPVELLAFGVSSTLRAIAPAQRRDAPPSPDGNVIADHLGSFEDPAALAATLSATAGVVEHGLFPPQLVSEILIGTEGGIDRRTGAKPAGS